MGSVDMTCHHSSCCRLKCLQRRMLIKHGCRRITKGILYVWLSQTMFRTRVPEIADFRHAVKHEGRGYFVCVTCFLTNITCSE